MSKPHTLRSLQTLKDDGKKFAVLTCYDSMFTQAVNEAGIEAILVGDSLGMVLQGQDSTLPVTIDDMVYHTQCVSRGNSTAFIIADMPFMAASTLDIALEQAGQLMRAGAHMVKVEGDEWLCDTVTQLTRNGIPVCAHLGLTPQSVNQLGGYRVQGREEAQAQAIVDAAVALQNAGASMILLECVPVSLADKVTKACRVPVIGIGAGNVTDAQVLVLHDMLGLNARPAKFVKNFMQQADTIQQAIAQYGDEVRSGAFPSPEHTFE